METETILILLFVVATTVAIAVQRLAIPYTVALVFTGLLLGMLNIFEAPHLTKALLFGVFLPGLLFEAAFHIEFKQFWRNRLIISSLALPGVVAAIVLTAVILTPVADALHFVQGFTWKHALVFGALIAATDPIAVVAIFTGGLAKAGDLLLKPTRRYMDDFLFGIYRGTVKLMTSGMEEGKGAILGAAALIWNELAL